MKNYKCPYNEKQITITKQVGNLSQEEMYGKKKENNVNNGMNGNNKRMVP